MRFALHRFFVFVFAFSGATTLAPGEDRSAAAFTFREVKYFHRWSQNEQHEFTPAKQEDLEHWSDMITINGYPGVKEGEALAEAANTVLGNYQNHGGKILNTRSVPRTEEQPAEHFISVLFSRPDFAEAAFARFKLVDGKGHSFVYSHRIYGKNATQEMNGWLAKTGKDIENALMKWDAPTEPISVR